VQEGNKQSYVKNLIVTLMYTWHMDNRWYTSDLHTYSSLAFQHLPIVASRLLSQHRMSWCQVLIPTVPNCCTARSFLSGYGAQDQDAIEGGPLHPTNGTVSCPVGCMGPSDLSLYVH
jgi:hypothetical protein